MQTRTTSRGHARSTWATVPARAAFCRSAYRLTFSRTSLRTAQAKLDIAATAADVQLSFGSGPAVTDVDVFVDAFLKRHAVALAAGPIGDSFVPEGKVASERVVFGKPLRDSGCRRIRIAFVVAPSGPVSMGRTCERFRRAPPSYASRPLPSTATGDTNTLVRVGAIGGFAGPSFSGFVIDRFGDVYDAHDYPGPYNVEPPGSSATASRRSRPPRSSSSRSTRRSWPRRGKSQSPCPPMRPPT